MGTGWLVPPYGLLEAAYGLTSLEVVVNGFCSGAPKPALDPASKSFFGPEFEVTLCVGFGDRSTAGSLSSIPSESELGAERDSWVLGATVGTLSFFPHPQSTTCPDFDESTCNTALHAGHLIFTLISFFVLSESAVRHSSWRAPSCCPDGAIRSYADLNPLILLLTLKPENDQRVRQTARSPPWDTVIGLTILQARRRGCAIPNLGSSSIHGISFSAAHFLRPIPNALAMPTKSVLSGTV